MPIVLFRVDDRLIHGQVVIGWGTPLGVDRIVLVDDQVSTSPWEQDLYRMAVSPEMDVRFVTIAEAATRLPEWEADGHRVLVLTGDLDTMAALYSAAADRREAHQSRRGAPPGRPARAAPLSLPER